MLSAYRLCVLWDSSLFHVMFVHHLLLCLSLHLFLIFKAYPVCKLGHGSDHITLADLQDSIQLCQHATDTKSVMLQGLSVLELCLIVSMKNITELSDGEPFNFEMVYEGTG